LGASLRVHPKFAAYALFVAAIVLGISALVLVVGRTWGTVIWIAMIAILSVINGIRRPREKSPPDLK
jgi:hypothetical protein